MSRVGNARIKVKASERALLKHPSNNNPDYTPIKRETIKGYNRARPRKQKLLCYAPFKNMYFGIDGSATACCYNRTHVFGKFPEHSIHEMWFGEKAKKLGDYMKCNDLSLGCDGCQYQLEAGNYTGTQAMYFDHYPVNRNEYPSVMQFEMSNLCNLECDMCSGEFSSLIRKNREGLPEIPCAYNDEFIEQLREFIPHLSYSKFYGGEPFLIDHYYKIWELMHELNPSIKIEVQTNATILNNRVKDVLDKLNINLNISLDSLEKSTYEKIRVNANFEKVMSNVDYFVNYKNQKGTRITMSMCPMRANWKELPEFVRFANKNDASVFFHMVWNPEHQSLWNLDSNSLQNMVAELSKAEIPKRSTTEKRNYKKYMDYLNLIKKWETDSREREDQLALEQEQEKIKRERESLKNQKLISEKEAYFAPKVTSNGAKEVLMTELKRYLASQEISSQDKQRNLLNDYHEQLNWLSGQLPNELDSESVFESLLVRRPIENVARELEKNDRPALLKTAIEYAEKIAEE